MKFLLIGLVFVHASLQAEVVPENAELTSKPHDIPKKYSKNEKHGEYAYKNDGHHKKHHEKFEKSHHSDESKEWKKREKSKRDERSEFQVTTRQEELDHPVSLLQDEKVNDVKRSKILEPQSEIIKPNKFNFYKEMNSIDLSEPPNANDTILMARYIVHNVDWAAIATLNSRSGVKHNPFVNVISMSDGPVEQGSGIPFFYMTSMDLSSMDLAKDNRASVTATLAQTDYCLVKSLDPQDPLCARVILSGKVKKVKPGNSEEEFARKALFSRHNEMESWPKDHEFYFAKLKIGEIILLDQFGGVKYLDVHEYLHTDGSSNKVLP